MGKAKTLKRAATTLPTGTGSKPRNGGGGIANQMPWAGSSRKGEAKGGGLRFARKRVIKRAKEEEGESLYSPDPRAKIRIANQTKLEKEG